MKIGPKYKIARRLGATIFEKTQGAKFAASKERRAPKFSKPKTGFGQQLIEKQKARFTYGISEKQFNNYANKVLDSGTSTQTDAFFGILESRLDNVVFRAGFAETRRKARQLVSHGHITVNGRKVNIPSFCVSKNDIVGIRVQSQSSKNFINLVDKIKDLTPCDWLATDVKKFESKVVGVPKYNPSQELFDLASVLEYYRR